MSCVFRKKSKRENTKQKLVGVCRGEKSVYERKKVSRKTHSVDVETEKQAGKTTPEAY